MNEDELARLLGDSFEAQARSAVPDRAVPPPPRFAEPAGPSRRSAARWLAPLAAAAVVIAVVAGALVIGRDTGGRPATTSAAAHPRTVPVQVDLLNTSGTEVGVGMPVVAYFSQRITDASALAAATTVTVDGRAAEGAWYFEQSSARPGFPVEGHLRMSSYWPAHAHIAVSLPIAGKPAGGDFAFADDVTLRFTTGAEQVVTVDDSSHALTVRRDGQQIDRFKVSLGAQATPTLRGVKVIIDKGRDISMRGPGYYVPHVRWTQQLTYSGEYLHAAPWNTHNIAAGLDTSNGCTNLDDGDAQRLYSLLRVGDVVEYPNADGPTMSLADGLGDWNVSWTQWRTGGLVPTS